MGISGAISKSLPANWMSLESAQSDGDPESMDYDSPLTELEDSSGSEYSSEPLSEDSGSEYGAEMSKKPAKKRAKAVKVAARTTAPIARAKAKGSGKGKKSLSLIVTVPLDILFEIFGLLEPIDLLHLSRTNRAFREVLSSKNATSVWKTVRVHRGGVPDCMPGMSEVQWANLLFGRCRCHACGTSGVQRIDFGIRLRACTSCLKKNLVFESSFSSKFPGFNPLIMDLIPFTNIGGWAHGRASGSKFFWSADVLKMGERFGAYQKDAHMCKPGAKQALEDFMESCRNYVASVINHVAVCNTWIDQDRERRLNDVARLRSQDEELIKTRLIQLGHNIEDVQCLFRRRGFAVDKDLTETRWKRLLPNIARELSEVKEERRLEEQRKTSCARHNHLTAMYSTYVQQLQATRWATMPACKDFLNFPDVAEFIDSPPSERQEIEACRTIMDRVSELCAEHIHRRKLAVMQLLPPNDVSQDTLGSQDTDTRDSLQLATSVFQCTRSQAFPLITWDKVQYHKCDLPVSGSNTIPYYGWSGLKTLCTFTISEPGVAAARSLLSLVGLDPEMTTASAMDQRQSHFFCSSCPPQPESGGSYRMAMNWRMSVLHYVEQRNTSHAEPRWELLNATQLEVVQSSRAPEYPGAHERVWCCNKCAAHFYPAIKATVVGHLRSWHGITSPNEGIDFIYTQDFVKRPPPGTKIFVTPPSSKPVGPGKCSQPPTQPNGGKQRTTDYRCRRCNLTSNRTFILGGVKQHLKDKHKVTSPHEGEHYCKVN